MGKDESVVRYKVREMDQYDWAGKQVDKKTGKRAQVGRYKSRQVDTYTGRHLNKQALGQINYQTYKSNIY